jgi:hypothetical protein
MNSLTLCSSVIMTERSNPSSCTFTLQWDMYVELIENDLELTYVEPVKHIRCFSKIISE